jgi:hypothetical protein
MKETMIKHNSENARFAGKPVRVVNAVTGVETEEVILPGMTTRNLCEQLKIHQRLQGNINVRNGKAGEYFGLNEELYPQIQRGTELYVYSDPEYGQEAR